MLSLMSAAMRKHRIGGRVILLALTLPATAAQAGFLDSLKEGLDDVSDGLKSAKEALDKSDSAKPASPPPAAGPAPQTGATSTQNNTQTAAPGAPANQNMHNILTKKEHYHLRPPYFSDFKFKTGKYKIEKYTDATFIPLYLPTYKGLPRLGQLPSYPAETLAAGPAQQVMNDNAVKSALAQRFVNDVDNQLMLCHMKLAMKEFTAQQILIDRSGTAEYEHKLIGDLYNTGTDGLAPRIDMERMAFAMLAPVKASEYFCQGGATCMLTNSLRYVWEKPNPWGGGPWGGWRDEFAARKAFRGFVEKELPKLKAWAGQQSCEYYLIGQSLIKDYDFSKKGFAVDVYLSDSHKVIYQARNKAKTYTTDANKMMHTAFLPMPEQQAEALLTKLKERDRGNPVANLEGYRVYAPVKVQVYKRLNSSTANYQYALDITSAQVEVFADDLLTDKLFNITMTQK